MLRLLTFSALVATAAPLAAQPANAPDRFSDGLTVAAGLSQPILFRGANASVTLRRGRFVADYSHGVALDLNASDGAALTQAETDQSLNLDVPWTTGFGVGVRITDRLDVRAEGKAHRFNATPPGGEAIGYTAFSVGPGVYYRIPVWRGLEIEPSIRYWPTVASTLSSDAATFTDASGVVQTHEAHSFGAFANVSVGWSL